MNLARLLLVTLRLLIFKARIMTDRCEYFVGGWMPMLTDTRKSVDVYGAVLRNKDRLVTNFSKNWHTTCRRAVVSKILDWLVQ